MFGIGGGEFVLIIIVVLMLFGSDKIPDIARGLAKGMAQLRNATNEIKHEISKSVEDNEVVREVKETINAEKLKKAVGYDELRDSLNTDHFNPLNDVQKTVEETKEEFENLTGPVKRRK